jgi:RHS repeat-associated protein
MPHTTIPKATSPTKTESPKVRYTAVVYPYSGLFPFAADTTQAAKEKGLTINKSILTQKRPPQKVGYRGKNWPNRVKKEFDTEGSVNGAGGIDAYYFGVRYYDPEIGIWLSTDPKRVGWNPYSYVEGNPLLYVDKKGENPLLAAMLINGLASAAIDFGMQYMASGGDMDQMRWGSVGASFVSGALTTGAMGAVAKAGGALAANTFTAMMQRSFIKNAIDFGVRSVGLAIDSKAHNLDYGKEMGRLALSSGLNMGTDAIQGLGNNALRNGWDPGFEDFRKRMTSYDSPWLKRFEPSTLHDDWETPRISDYIGTTTQRSVTIFIGIEIISPSPPQQQNDGTVYLPDQNCDGVECW